MRGSIQVRTLKDGTRRYHAVWRAGGKQHRKAFAKRKEASRFLAETVAAVHEGSWHETRPALMQDVFKLWLENLETRVMMGEVKASTQSTYRCNVRKHLGPAFGEYRSDHLTPRVVAGWRRRMAEKIAAGAMSAKSYNNLHNLLHQILTWARHPAQGFIAHDPLIGVKRLRVRHREAEYLEDSDMQALLAAVANDPEANAIIHIALFGGLRRGEAFGLQWHDLEPFQETTGGRLHVRRSVYKGDVTAPKTEAGERIVDVPQRVLDAIARHGETCPAVGDGFIFRTSKGAPIDPNSWYMRRFVKIREEAGLRSTVGLHSLRHTYASLLIRQGENPKYVSAQLGHSSTSFTMDRYGHLFEASSAEAMQRLEKLAPTGRPRLRVVGRQQI